MDIRITVMMSIFGAALVVGGCASTEETRPASGPSMKEIPSAKPKDTPQPMAKEPTVSAPTKETASSSDSRTAVNTNPLQACLDAIAKGATAGQRSLAEQTCQRDFGSGDSRTVSSGTQGDSLQGCIARIPQDATPGQRMMAEESCRRDEEVRKGF
ncbi:hypothetical protein [Nitrospira sp. Nam74]